MKISGSSLNCGSGWRGMKASRSYWKTSWRCSLQGRAPAPPPLEWRPIGAHHSDWQSHWPLRARPSPPRGGANSQESPGWSSTLGNPSGAGCRPPTSYTPKLFGTSSASPPGPGLTRFQLCDHICFDSVLCTKARGQGRWPRQPSAPLSSPGLCQGPASHPLLPHPLGRYHALLRSSPELKSCPRALIQGFQEWDGTLRTARVFSP